MSDKTFGVKVLTRIKKLNDEGLETHEMFDVLKNEFPLGVTTSKRGYYTLIQIL
jgi:translation initiation factor 1 (eIF-1/SUI1)